MAQLFPQDFIQEVISRNSLEDVVGNYVQLKRGGSALKGLCPFHKEKTPSFSVSPDKQLYYCFGCSKGGNVIEFIKEIEGLDFVEAVKFLAERAGVDIPEPTGEHGIGSEGKRILMEINKEAAMYYYNKLPDNPAAMEYLKNRKINAATINRFALGYAPDSSEIIDYLRDKGYTEEQIFQAGITAKSDSGRVYLRFRNRLIFPIVDRRRNVIAFGGRLLGEGKPKYLNSSDTPVYNKSMNLYALNLAAKSKEEYFILAEGYMDVISLHQNGIDCAVATLGTALTVQQARVIKRCKNEVVIAYDSDEAGQAATARAIEILCEEGMKVRVISQHSSKDPDEFVKEFGVGAFKQLVNDAPVQIEYKIHKLKARYDLKDMQGKIAYIKEIAGEIAKFDSAVERELYAVKCADDIGVSHESVLSEIEKRVGGKKKYSVYRPEKVQIKKHDNKAEKMLLGLMCQDGMVTKKAFESLNIEDFTEGAYRELAEVLKDGKDLQAYMSSPEVSGELFEILFCNTDMEDVEMGAAELISELIRQKHKRLLEKALQEGDVNLINELLHT